MFQSLILFVMTFSNYSFTEFFHPVLKVENSYFHCLSNIYGESTISGIRLTNHSLIVDSIVRNSVFEDVVMDNESSIWTLNILNNS